MQDFKSDLTELLFDVDWQSHLAADKVSLDELVNIFGDMKDLEKIAKKIAGYCREMIDGRMEEDEDEYESDYYSISRTFSETTKLNNDLIRASETDEWIEEHSKTTESTTIKYAHIEEEEG